MKILVLGAGVIGTTYAWKLSSAGHTVVLFVREGKCEQIEKTVSSYDAKMKARNKQLRQKSFTIRL